MAEFTNSALAILLGIVGAVIILSVLLLLMIACTYGLERIRIWRDEQESKKQLYNGLKRSLFRHLERGL